MAASSISETISTDTLEQRLVELEGIVSKARAAQVGLLRELDLRQIPLADGCRNLAEWIVSRLDVSPETAVGLTRLVSSPSEPLDTSLADGVVTVDRAVELTRLDGVDPVSETEHLSFPRLRHHIALRRRHTRADEREAHAERFLMLQPTLDQTGLRLWGELVGIDAAHFQQVVTEAADQIPTLPSGRREARRARLADALVNLVIDRADGGESVSAPVVSVLVDATQATDTNGETGVITMSGVRLGSDALEAILCDSVVEVNARTSDGRHHPIGHLTHSLPPRLRRLIHQRDGGMCTADGCPSRYRLQPHHIVRRIDGGSHEPDNLTLLCWFHHHVVIHRHGHRIDPHSPPGRIRFLPPEPGVDPPV